MRMSENIAVFTVSKYAAGAQQNGNLVVLQHCGPDVLFVYEFDYRFGCNAGQLAVQYRNYVWAVDNTGCVCIVVWTSSRIQLLQSLHDLR